MSAPDHVGARPCGQARHLCISSVISASGHPALNLETVAICCNSARFMGRTPGHMAPDRNPGLKIL
jgi:hypothetical protein